MSEGFNAVGISQGGLLLRFAPTHNAHWHVILPRVSRGLAERCPVPMKTLITFGSPHQGVFGVPHCVETTDSYLLCELVRQLISLGEAHNCFVHHPQPGPCSGAYIPWIQDLVATAQYWHDPINGTAYSQGQDTLIPIR